MESKNLDQNNFGSEFPDNNDFREIILIMKIGRKND